MCINPPQAKKSHRNSNPIYNLLPDVLSHLSCERDLPSKDAEAIMEVRRQGCNECIQQDQDLDLDLVHLG